MRFSKCLIVLFCLSLYAQLPIGISGTGISQNNSGDQIYYFTTATNGGTPSGDAVYGAWGATSLLSIPGNGFPDATGFPFIVSWNDGATAAPDPVCSGNLGLAQLVKLPPLGTAATSANTLQKGLHCLSSYSAGGIGTAPNGTWNDSRTWKTGSAYSAIIFSFSRCSGRTMRAGPLEIARSWSPMTGWPRL